MKYWYLDSLNWYNITSWDNNKSAWDPAQLFMSSIVVICFWSISLVWLIWATLKINQNQRYHHLLLLPAAPSQPPSVLGRISQYYVVLIFFPSTSSIGSLNLKISVPSAQKVVCVDLDWGTEVLRPGSDDGLIQTWKQCLFHFFNHFLFLYLVIVYWK